MFVGCIFWLLSEASMISGSGETTLFTPAPIKTGELKTMNQTVADIQSMGCIVTKYTKQYLGGYENVTYQTLIVEVSKTKLVYTAVDDKGRDVLLVETTGKTVQWYPEA